MKARRLVAIVAFYSLGIFTGGGLAYLGLINRPMEAQDYHPIRAIGLDEYSFINPLFGYETPNSAEESSYEALTEQLEKLVEEYKAQSLPGARVSVYFRDSTVGRWVGLNEDERYTPASLLKVAIMIAYYKSADRNPEILEEEIEYTPEIHSLIGTVPHDQGTELVVGTKYTIDRLIREMITKSDNGATYALLTRVDQSHLDELYREAGLPNPANQGRDFTISIKDYSLMLRIMYNSTYLSRDMSEKALALLHESTFKDGLVAGVSKDVKVAHKHGSAVISEPSGNLRFELHDCGYTYYPERTYLLCVMTGGDNQLEMTKVIQRISETVYQDIKRR